MEWRVICKMDRIGGRCNRYIYLPACGRIGLYPNFARRNSKQRVHSSRLPPPSAVFYRAAKLNAAHNVTAFAGDNAIGSYDGGEVATELGCIANTCDFSCPAPIALQGIAAAKFSASYG